MKLSFSVGLSIGLVGLFSSVYAFSRPNIDSQAVENWLNSANCLSCHASHQTENEIGKKAFNFDRLQAGLRDPSQLIEADLAKLQFFINEDNSSLKFNYRHEKDLLNAEQKQQLMSWIVSQRERFLPKNTAGVEDNRLVQPLPDSLPTDARKVALGQSLFHDTRLSANNTISCESCHQLDKGGVDNLPVSEGIHGKLGSIDAPTVFNSAFNLLQFWDGRAKDLAEQAKGPPLNPVEMGSKDWQEILAKFSEDREFMQRFLEVYPKFDEVMLTDAIAEFEKTLITPNSSFDRFLKGDTKALTRVQKRGYAVFQMAKCDTCHTGSALGGTSFEHLGIHDNYFADRASPLTEADNGRFNATQNPQDKHTFKVPSLRNVALTAPYMHDGSVKTLDDAVQKMARFQSGVDLAENQVKDLVAFLESLTGEYQGKPLTGEKTLSQQEHKKQPTEK